MNLHVTIFLIFIFASNAIQNLSFYPRITSSSSKHTKGPPGFPGYYCLLCLKHVCSKFLPRICYCMGLEWRHWYSSPMKESEPTMRLSHGSSSAATDTPNCTKSSWSDWTTRWRSPGGISTRWVTGVCWDGVSTGQSLGRVGCAGTLISYRVNGLELRSDESMPHCMRPTQKFNVGGIHNNLLWTTKQRNCGISSEGWCDFLTKPSIFWLQNKTSVLTMSLSLLQAALTF
jgi:hypothetical protein